MKQFFEFWAAIWLIHRATGKPRAFWVRLLAAPAAALLAAVALRRAAEAGWFDPAFAVAGLMGPPAVGQLLALLFMAPVLAWIISAARRR